MFACSGILYNHESPRRGYEFVTRKIVSSAVKIKVGLQKQLILGNLDARRDWGFAPDYVHAMWLMLQRNEPDDYVVATGETHTVQEFAAIAFSCLGLDYEQYIAVDPKFFRPAEKIELCGNPDKIVKELGWSRTKTFSEMVESMIDNEMRLYRETKGR
jgi:GDPmannose 4,6-dehydratase